MNVFLAECNKFLMLCYHGKSYILQITHLAVFPSPYKSLGKHLCSKIMELQGQPLLFQGFLSI